MTETLKIVALGGGTGLSTMLRGLKKYSRNLTAVVTMSDDGGGSGILRQDLGMLPPGDIRNCLLALADIEPTMEKLFTYRFDDGILRGQSFGNLFLAAMNGVYGDFEEAVRHANEVLAVVGKVLPVTNQDIRMCAEFEDGKEVFGESKIANAKIQNGGRIKKVSLVPSKVEPASGVLESIAEADMVILGPGSLYTSVIPTLLVNGVSDAVRKSRAKKIFVCNVMTQPGETDGYSAIDHIKALEEHAGMKIVDYCVVNTGRMREDVLKRYAEDRQTPVSFDKRDFAEHGIKLIEADMHLDNALIARHNPDILAKTIIDFYKGNAE